MEKTKKEIQVTNADCEDLVEELELGWPVKFFVCELHKEECFSEYDHAILDESRSCELCNPKENDSLGG